MTTFADPTPDHYQKQPGQWRRKSKDGPPLVTDPDGATTARGTVALRTYARPSNFGKQVENTYNLTKWNERMVALGVATVGEGQLDDLLEPPYDTPGWKSLADEWVVAAKRQAGAFLAAERGTVGHLITEDSDLGHSLITRIEQGEDAGLPAHIQLMVREAWEMLIAEHFEVLAVEFPCVYDRWRVAGTGDRIVRLKHSIYFHNGEQLWGAIPADTVLVLDIKTGGLKTDTNGLPIYWHSYAVQIAAYARSVPYDVDLEQRGEWPWQIDHQRALIAHLDIGRALETGEMVAQLVYVDLVAGYKAGELVCAAKDWQKRKDVFSPVGQHVVTTGAGLVAETPVVSIAPPVAAVEADTGRVDRTQEEQPSSTDLNSITTGLSTSNDTTTPRLTTTPNAARPSSNSSTPSPSNTPTSSSASPDRPAIAQRLNQMALRPDSVKARAKALVDAGHGKSLAYDWPTYPNGKPIPGFKGDHQHTPDELAAILHVIRQVEDEQNMPFHQADAPAPVTEPFYKIAGWLPTVEGKPPF